LSNITIIYLKTNFQTSTGTTWSSLNDDDKKVLSVLKDRVNFFNKYFAIKVNDKTTYFYATISYSNPSGYFSIIWSDQIWSCWLFQINQDSYRVLKLN